LVLLDVMLPDMDGFSVCQALKKNARTREIPVLLATGLNDTRSVEKGYEVGATDFLSKPFSWALLVNRIKYLLRNDDLRQKLQEISDQQKAANLALEQEVKERSRAEQKVREMALHDPLTGLANRKKFHQDLAALLAGIGEGYCGVGVMFLDLDRFKQINDTFGHATGDGVLKAVAEVLRVSTRSTDVVARLGGDEFAIVLAQHDDVGYVMRVAKRILRELSEPIFIEGSRVSVGTSIGVMLTCDRRAAPDQLISNADQALYQAKEAGRGQIRIFDHALGQKLRKSRQLEDAFEGAGIAANLRFTISPRSPWPMAV
jgi:diguanylate cyclase (GGDEF)-like protein